MAVNVWEPKAIPQTQVYTFSVDTLDVNDDYAIQIRDPDDTSQVFYISCQTPEDAWTTIDDIVEVLMAKFESLIHPFKSRVTMAFIGAEGSRTGLTISAATPGLPIDVTDISNPAGNTTLTLVTANAGPYDVGNADNWSLGHIPEAGEDILFDEYEQGPCSNITALSAILLVNATFKMTHTGLVGTRRKGLQLKLSGKLVIGEGMITDEALGSSRMNIELVDADNEVEVLNSCSESYDEGYPVVRISMAGAAGKCRVRKANMRLTVAGTLGVLEVSTITAITDTTLTVDGSPTITALTQYGGTTILKGIATTATIFGGVFEHVGSGAMGALVVGFNGAAYLSSGGNITSINCSGVVNLRMNSQPRTIGACTLFKGYELYGFHDIHTFTTGIIFDGCKVSDGIFEMGQNYKLTPSVPA